MEIGVAAKGVSVRAVTLPSQMTEFKLMTGLFCQLSSARPKGFVGTAVSVWGLNFFPSVSQGSSAGKML